MKGAVFMGPPGGWALGGWLFLAPESACPDAAGKASRAALTLILSFTSSLTTGMKLDIPKSERLKLASASTSQMYLELATSIPHL